MEILTTALSVLLVIVIAHFVIFWVVRTMYPPAPVPAPVVFTQPTVIQQPEPQQNVVIPTYETPIPVEAPRKEEQPRGPPPPEATSIHGNSGLDTANTQ